MKLSWSTVQNIGKRKRAVAFFLVCSMALSLAITSGVSGQKIRKINALDIQITCHQSAGDNVLSAQFINDFCSTAHDGLQRRYNANLIEHGKIVIDAIIEKKGSRALQIDFKITDEAGRTRSGQSYLDIIDGTLRPSMGDTLANDIARQLDI